MRINEEKLSKSLSNTHKKGALMGGGGKLSSLSAPQICPYIMSTVKGYPR